MLDTFLMKVFIVLGGVAGSAIWVKYVRLSRIRKPGAEMPALSRPLALATGVLDRVFIFISLIFAFLFFLNGYPDILLPFSCYFDFPLQLTGMALLVASMFESWWAITSMGEFNQPRWAHLKQGHTVVKTGAYRYLRHPQYASKMLAYLGLFLFFKDFFFLLVFFCSVLLFYFQAKSEEKLLTQVFGEEYKNYQAITGMFLPLVLSQWIRRGQIATLRTGTKTNDKCFPD